MLKPVLAALLGTVLVAGVFGIASAGARPAAKRTVTLHLVEKSVGQNFVDNPPRQGFSGPPLIGDQFAFTSELQTRSGARTGELDATCTITRGGVNALGACYGVFSLKGGQLAGITAAGFGQKSGPAIRIAIVGGTGAYEGVTGSVVSVSRGQNSPYTDDTFHLIWP